MASVGDNVYYWWYDKLRHGKALAIGKGEVCVQVPGGAIETFVLGDSVFESISEAREYRRRELVRDINRQEKQIARDTRELREMSRKLLSLTTESGNWKTKSGNVL